MTPYPWHSAAAELRHAAALACGVGPATVPQPYPPRRAAAVPPSSAAPPHPRLCRSRARTAVGSGDNVPIVGLPLRRHPVFRTGWAALAETSPRARRQTRDQTRIRLEARVSDPRRTPGRRPGAGAASELRRTTGGSGGASLDAKRGLATRRRTSVTLCASPAQPLRRGKTGRSAVSPPSHGQAGGKTGEGPPCHAVASIVVPKRPGGYPTRPATAADQRRAGWERLLAALPSSPGRSRGSAVEPRHRNEPREGRRERPRDFASAAAPQEGQEKHRRATPTPPRRGEAGESARGKAGGGAPTSRERDEGSSVVSRRRRGRNFRFCFFVFTGSFAMGQLVCLL